MTPDYVLTPGQFATLWADLRLGAMPYPLDVYGTGREDVDHLRRDLEPLLRLLDSHQIAIDLVADVDGPVRALAVSNGRFALRAMISTRGVELSVIRPTGLPVALLEVLPHADAGPGHALSVPVEAMQKAAALVDAEDDGGDDYPWGGGGEYDERSAFVKAGLSQADAALMSELTTGRIAGGQFGVSLSDGVTRRRGPMVLTWFDTARGRYMMVKDGAWLSVAPADQGRLLARISSLLSRSAAA